MRYLAVAALVIYPTLALCEDEFREDFDSVEAWVARPDWLGARAEAPEATAVDGVGRFTITELNRGMKWRRELDDVDPDLAPWLVIRYRVTNAASAGADYLLWLGDTGGEGIKLIAKEGIPADGEWHVQAFDLVRIGARPPLTALAVQSFAGEAVPATLEVDYIAITDAPPADAPGVEPTTTEGWRRPLDRLTPEAWSVEPSWLANYTPQSACEATAEGLKFSVAEPGRGAKWSCELPEAVEGARWVAMRYRATGMQSSPDYALYIAQEPGGKARQEQYVITLSDIIDDGAWHVQTSLVEVPGIKSLAVQVQCDAAPASLEVSDITLLEHKAPVPVSAEFPCRHRQGPPPAGFRIVELGPGDTAGSELSRRLGYVGWIGEGDVTVRDIPFTLRPEAEAVCMTPIRGAGAIEVPVSGRAAELYLLLAAKLPARDEPSFRSEALRTIDQVERFVAQIDYEDGSSEQQFPFQPSSARHCISRGLGLYALALDPQKALRRIALHDGFHRGAFGLIAATLSERPGPATEATEFAPAIQVPRPMEDLPAVPTGIHVGEQQLTATTAEMALRLDWSAGLRLAELRSLHPGGDALAVAPGPLFRIRSGELSLTSEDFAVTEVTRETDGRVVLRFSQDGTAEPLQVSVWVGVGEGPEVELRATCSLPGLQKTRTQFFFPELAQVRVGDGPEDTWYWMPRRGDVINNIPINLREPYGGLSPLQVFGAFGPQAGAGVYLRTEDLTGMPRLHNLRNADGAVTMGVEFTPYEGQETPRLLIGCSQGDWHEQFARYLRWVSTWHRPAAPPKQWFREVFNFRQHFLHFALPEKSGLFDPDTKTFDMRTVIDADIEAFGGVDYLHLFDWGWDPVSGRCGDYEPWDYLGGVDNFRSAVQEVKDMGIPVGLYIEGYLVDPQSNLGKQYGEKWQLLGPEKEPYTYFAPSFNICSWVGEWQDYLSATYARAREQSGAVGFYIDEYGFTSPGHFCHNESHDHPIPAGPIPGEREMTRRVREAVGPDCALYTEESPPDITSVYQDGSFTYNISSASDRWSPTHINLYRFAFPQFKTINIITCDRPLGSNVGAVKRILFNGEAIWLEGIAHRWFTPETRAYISRMHRVLRANRRCFAGDYPTPLIPTPVRDLYANAFAERQDGRGKTCFTVLNAGFRTYDGDVLRVRHFPGATYADELTGEPPAVRIEGDTAVLSFRIGPRDVAVVSRDVGDG